MKTIAKGAFTKVFDINSLTAVSGIVMIWGWGVGLVF